MEHRGHHDVGCAGDAGRGEWTHHEGCASVCEQPAHARCDHREAPREVASELELSGVRFDWTLEERFEISPAVLKKLDEIRGEGVEVPEGTLFFDPDDPRVRRTRLLLREIARASDGAGFGRGVSANFRLRTCWSSRRIARPRISPRSPSGIW